jgi:uncharacterized protein
MKNKKTLVVGVSNNSSRYANLAVNRLNALGFEVIALGKSTGSVNGLSILTGMPRIENVHTISIYLRPEIQKPLYKYLLSLHPSRIIFNPGTENPEFEILAKEAGIETLEACTLVMLSVGVY